MPWRFRRSVKILPGVRWNVGRRGTSWTFGGKGVRTTIRKGGVRRSFSIPGTGLSYTTSSKAGACCPLMLLMLPFFAIQNGFRSLFK
jgi:hypothetical protein